MEEKNPLIGREFGDIEELNAFLEEYQLQTKTVFTIRSSSPLRTDDPNSTKFQIKRRTYICVFGNTRQSKSSGKRSGRTIKRDCPAQIIIGLNKSKTALQIKKIVDHHENHEHLQEMVDHLPQRRQLKGECQEQVKEWLKMRVPKVEILKNLREKEGKLTTRKDLDNLLAKVTEHAEDSVKKAVEILEQTYDAKVAVLADEHQEFKGLFFSTEEMRKDLAMFPEMLFVDGTYKLFKRDFVLMYLAIEDGNGRTQVVGVGILSDEQGPTVEWMFEEFKRQHGSAANNIKCVITDKDFVERTSITTVFPDMTLYLCEFHTLKALNRAVTEKKMKISADQVKKCKQLLNGLVKSKTRKEYDKKYEEFCECSPVVVIEYFNKNWHGIHEQWSKCFMNEGTFGNYTNNRVESLNANTKKVLKRRDALIPAIHELFKFFGHRNAHMDADKARDILRQERVSFLPESAEGRFKNALTSYAFSIVKKELDASKYIDLHNIHEDTKVCTYNSYGLSMAVTLADCSCATWTSYQLPCRHIFAVRNHFSYPLYDDQYHERWKETNSLRSTQQIKDSVAINVHSSPRLSKVTTPKKMSEKEKRSVIEPSLNSILYMTIQGTQSQFNERKRVIKELENYFRQNLQVRIIPIQASQDQAAAQTNVDVSTTLADLSIEDYPISEQVNRITVEQDAITSVADIVLPVPIKVIGRPRSAAYATLPQPKKKNKSTVFVDKVDQDQHEAMLSWIIPKKMIGPVLAQEHVLTMDEIPTSADHLADPIISDGIVLDKLKQFMDHAAFTKLKAVVKQKIDEGHTHCILCNNRLEGNSVRCKGCLFTFHLRCVNRKSVPRTPWFCASCK